VIGKLLGKVLGEVVAAPVTIAAETVEAATTAIDTAGEALARGMDKITGEQDPPPRRSR
jgi:hypothetical protein